MMRQWLESILIINTTMKKETPKNGPYREYLENGQILEANYKDGKEDGKRTYWWVTRQNRQIISKRIYKDGVCISGNV